MYSWSIYDMVNGYISPAHAYCLIVAIVISMQFQSYMLTYKCPCLSNSHLFWLVHSGPQWDPQSTISILQWLMLHLWWIQTAYIRECGTVHNHYIHHLVFVCTSWCSIVQVCTVHHTVNACCCVYLSLCMYNDIMYIYYDVQMCNSTSVQNDILYTVPEIIIFKSNKQIESIIYNHVQFMSTGWYTPHITYV